MKSKSILLFGATRGVGHHVLTQALEAGHDVTVVARDSASVNVEHSHLRVVQGDATDPEFVDEVMPGHDVVISTVGAPPSSRDRVRERATRAQVTAMKKHGISRLVSLSSHGVGESEADLPWMMRWFIVPLILRRAFDDHEVQDSIVRDSGLDWTLVKPTNLHDGPPTGDVAHGFVQLPKGRTMKVSRADVAAFMLAQLEDSTYVQRESGITA